MTKRTDDEVAKTPDENANIDKVDGDAETKILTPENKAETTQRISDPNEEPKNTATETPFTSTATIGDYRIIRKIGEGGMGVVYEAEQQNPRRLVALKVVRGGLHADDYHVRMFRREIQALARLKHPGIASIYESGRSDDGQVFFAMELVQGSSLTDFVENCRLSGSEAMSDINDQLELFSKICDVVSYAHQRGVIHRDLKPQNILVTDQTKEQAGTDSGSDNIGVKILDFGLARITDPDIAGGASDMSQIGQIKGTLLYMSPEQVREKPDDIDVRSDVYSLGVMLYEMLTGQMPYDVSQVSLPEAIRIICEEAPRMPSKVWTASTKRSGRIDVDVETIVLKALEKEPGRRYQSVAALIDDIERYLTNQPILARPPSAFYQFRKLVARQKAAFASLGVIFLMILGFGIVMAAQSVRIANERDKALKAGQTAEERKNQAEKLRNDALVARNAEQKQRKIAEDNLSRAESEQKRAEEQKSLAEKARNAEKSQRQIAETNLARVQIEKKRAEEQKTIAEKQTALAAEQQALAETRKKEAENNAEANRRLLYVAKINLAQQAWEQSDVRRMDELLESLKPAAGKADLRGFEWYYLWRLYNQDLRTMQLAPGNVAFSRSGKEIIGTSSYFDANTNTDRPKISVMDVNSGEEIDSIPNRRFLTLSNDGKLIAITESKNNRDPGTIEILDLKNKKTSASTIYRPEFRPSFSPDRKLMFNAGQNGTVEILDLTSGSKMLTLREGDVPKRLVLPAFAFSSAYSSDRKLLAVLNNESNLTLWDIVKKRKLGVLKTGLSTFFVNGSMATRIAFSPDGKTLATNNSDTIRLWDVSKMKELARWRTEPGVQAMGPNLEFSPDGRMLAAVNGIAIELWDIASGRLGTRIQGHRAPIRFISFSPDSKTLVSNSIDGTTKLWSFRNYGSAETLEGQVGVGISPDGGTLATLGVDGRLRLRDFATRREVETFGVEEIAKSRSSTRLGFSPGGKVLVVLRDRYLTGKLELWNLVSKEKVADFGENGLDFAVSPDGRLVATVVFKNRELSVVLWNAATRKILSSFKGGGSIAFSPNGTILAIGYDNEIRLVNTSDLNESVPPLQISSRTAMAFSPDGKILATALGTVLQIWDFKSGNQIGELKGHLSFINFLAFSPDGSRLLTGDAREVKVWDLRTQQPVFTIKERFLGPAMFSPDGRHLIMGNNTRVRIWYGATNEEVAERRGH